MEILTDNSHYIFQFHDQFIEVIANVFWYEVVDECLLNKTLQPGHPLLRVTKRKHLNYSCMRIRNKDYKNNKIRRRDIK